MNDKELMGTCDTCDKEYVVSDNTTRCGTCGECSECCDHLDNGLNTYHVEQRAEIWVRATVQARTAADAMELGKAAIENGDYVENPGSFVLIGESDNPTNDYWIGGTQKGVAVSLNKDGSITELRYKD